MSTPLGNFSKKLWANEWGYKNNTFYTKVNPCFNLFKPPGNMNNTEKEKVC